MSLFDQSDIDAIHSDGAKPAPSGGLFDSSMISDVDQANKTASQPSPAPFYRQWMVNAARNPVSALEGTFQTGAKMANEALGQVASGWRGVIGVLNPFESTPETVSAMKNVQDWFGNTPQNQASKEQQELISEGTNKLAGAVESGANTITPGLGEAITKPGQTTGDAVYNMLIKHGAPPEVAAQLGAVAHSLPAAAAMLLGTKNASFGEGANGESIFARAAHEKQALGKTGATEPTAAPLSGIGAAEAKANPYPALAAEETSRGTYPIVKLTKVAQDATPQEQATRASIANQILDDPSRLRTGVLTGNIDTLRNEYEMARAANPTPAGQLIKMQIADEQSALSNYANKLLDSTLASPQFANNYQRGNFLNDVMWGDDGIKGFVNSQKKAIYDKAFERAGNSPVQTSNLDALTSNPQFSAELQLAGQKDFLGGMSNLIDMAKTQGFEGAPAGSVAALEKLRQSLNRQWTPQNKYFIGRAADAIDEDIAAAGGPGLLEQARNLHQVEKTLFNAKGIKTLFGDVDPNGVQTATPFEKVPQKLNDMPMDQWRHIYDLYDSVASGHIRGTDLQIPLELRMAAQQAKAEMAGSLVREIRDAGTQNLGAWNANAANKVMNSRASKLSIALDPQQQEALHTLNYGGQIMPSQFSYEGAGQQMRRMNEGGLLEKHAPQIGATAGAFTRIPGAEWLGAKLGEKLGGGVKLKRLMQEAHDLDAQMEANAKLGAKK